MWTLYRIDCQGSVIYIGITTNLKERWRRHSTGQGARITRFYTPVEMTVLSQYDTYKEANRAECEHVRLLRSQGYTAYGGGKTKLDSTVITPLAKAFSYNVKTCAKFSF